MRLDPSVGIPVPAALQSSLSCTLGSQPTIHSLLRPYPTVPTVLSLCCCVDYQPTYFRSLALLYKSTSSFASRLVVPSSSPPFGFYSYPTATPNYHYLLNLSPCLPNVPSPSPRDPCGRSVLTKRTKNGNSIYPLLFYSCVYPNPDTLLPQRIRCCITTKRPQSRGPHRVCPTCLRDPQEAYWSRIARHRERCRQ